MRYLTVVEIKEALERLGQLAQEKDLRVELLIIGGAAMALAYQTRLSTRDVDAIALAPDTATVRQLADVVATERGWETDWLNDGAKGYLVGVSDGPIIFQAAGIVARRPAVTQLLALKLSAWRDEVDIGDARRLLQELDLNQTPEQIWEHIKPYLVPGRELKARYALGDLWEAVHGDAK